MKARITTKKFILIFTYTSQFVILITSFLKILNEPSIVSRKHIFMSVFFVTNFLLSVIVLEREIGIKKILIV